MFALCFVNEVFMIKNIVFDVGNVIARYEPEKMLSGFCLTPDEIEECMKYVFRTKYWADADRGLGWHDEVLLPCIEKLSPKCADTVKEICFPHDFEQKYMPAIEGMDGVLKNLKDRGYKLYVLSNFGFGFHNFAPHIKAFAYCDGLFPSCDYLLLKPEREIYEKFFEVFSLNPSECLFIDDTLANIEGGRNCGMDGIQFCGLNETPVELLTKINNYLK